ncbi:hypothetical protein AB4Z21_37365, partial [Paenibacillus sp. MCAF20]
VLNSGKLLINQLIIDKAHGSGTILHRELPIMMIFYLFGQMTLKKKNELNSIRFTYSEITESLERTRLDMLGFIEKPLYQWLVTRDKAIADNMKSNMYKWFLKDG